MKVECMFEVRKIGRWIATALFLPAFLVVSACNEGVTSLNPGDEFQDCDICPVMVVIPAGEFMMGAREYDENAFPAERPSLKVRIDYDFAVSKFEVTEVQFYTCQKAGYCSQSVKVKENSEFPVYPLTWNEAKAYTAWMAIVTGKPYRLLSESEWEYAARGGTDTIHWWGDVFQPDMEICWGCTGQTGKDEGVVRKGNQIFTYSIGRDWYPNPQPVGRMKPNPFGLYDVAGNVSEWVEDCHRGAVNQRRADGSPQLEGDARFDDLISCKKHTAKGGQFDDKPKDIRLSWRFSMANFKRIEDEIGIRLGLTLDDE